jgi:hypothetical protein
MVRMAFDAPLPPYIAVEPRVPGKLMLEANGGDFSNGCPDASASTHHLNHREPSPVGPRLSPDVTKFDGFNEEHIGAASLFPTMRLSKGELPCCELLSRVLQPPSLLARPLFLTKRWRSGEGAGAGDFTARAPLALAAALPELSVIAVWRGAATAIAEGPIARRLIAGGILIAELQSGRPQ